MKKIFNLVIVIIGLVMITTNAKARPNVDYNRLVLGPITNGPIYNNGTMGNATLQSSVNVKLRIVRFTIQNLSGAFTPDVDEVDVALFTKMPSSNLAPLSYRSDPSYSTEGFFQDVPPLYYGWPQPTHMVWLSGNEEFLSGVSTNELRFNSLLTPLSQSKAINWEMGYTYDSSVSFSGNFIPSLIDIAGTEFTIMVPEIVPVDSSIADIDADGVPDLQDNCIIISNTNQDNSDFDGFITGFEPANYGDACDGDFNNDEVVNFGDIVNMLGFVNPPTVGTTYMDINQDGVVNFGDVVVLLGWVNQPVGPTGL